MPNATEPSRTLPDRFTISWHTLMLWQISRA
jgi:hypothetical protein